MRLPLIATLAALALASCQGPEEPKFSLSNPDASPEARRVFQALADAYGQRTLSGAMANVNWNDAEARLVHEATGQWPEVLGLDYIDIAATDSTLPWGYDPYEDFTVARDHWRRGGIVAVGWHWSVPAAKDSSRLVFRTDTEFRIENMLKPGTWENAVMERDLKLVVDQLRRFRREGIPVLWRPLHEASGNRKSGGEEWFWWGNGGPEAYVKLWRHMYDHFR
ncbi:glycoside hydrolase family 26 protein, partial [Salmonella enterica]|nr:glycoside hydrolase family 26 protein [Salmonella enterica]